MRKEAIIDLILKEAFGYTNVMPREFYLHKEHHTKKIEHPELGLVFHVSEKPDERGRWYAIAYQGKASKPLWNYAYRSEDDMNKSIERQIELTKSREEGKAEKRKERAEYKHDYKVEDILVSSWGYDQTNISYYQVVELKDKAIVIKEIGKTSVGGGGGYDVTVTPMKDHFVGPAMLKRVSPRGSVKINSYAWAYKWDGKPDQETAPGFGH